MTTVFIISAPSGSGKSTLVNGLMRTIPGLRFSVSYTTREPRAGEVHGQHYYFVTRSEFEQMMLRDEFLEHAEVFGNYYGTPLKQLEHMLEEGKIAVLKIDVQGALTAIDLRPDATTIFIMPPSMEELDRRIRARATESHEDIERRLAVAHQEISTSSRYRHRVINDDVETVVQQLEDIVRSGI